MKILLASAFLFTSFSALAGLNLRCHLSEFGATFVVSGVSSLECEDKERNNFDVQFDGIGPGLEIVEDSSIKINCPLVNKKRILKGKPFYAIGSRISIGAYKGIEIGAAVNHRGGICTIVGLNDSSGASVLVGLMSIKAP